MNAWTLSDSERKCERCKQAKAVVIFDNAQLCAACAKTAEQELMEEPSHDRRKAAARTR